MHLDGEMCVEGGGQRNKAFLGFVLSVPFGVFIRKTPCYQGFSLGAFSETSTCQLSAEISYHRKKSDERSSAGDRGTRSDAFGMEDPKHRSRQPRASNPGLGFRV